jgi:hypothetical protein
LPLWHQIDALNVIPHPPIGKTILTEKDDRSPIDKVDIVDTVDIVDIVDIVDRHLFSVRSAAPGTPVSRLCCGLLARSLTRR